jgi:hypothetical protein
MKAKTIDLTDIAQIQDRLRTAPSRPETNVRYIKAIEIMAAEIHAMRSKGYGWSDIAVVLTENGLHVSATTLRSYFSRVAGDVSRAPRRAPRRHHKPVPPPAPSAVIATPRPASPPSTRDAPTRTEKTSKPSLAVKPSTVAAPSTLPSTATSTDGETTPRWSFAVRPDTPNL